jgi:hypothetical protein
VTANILPEQGAAAGCTSTMSFAIDGPGGADQAATDARAVARQSGTSSSTGFIQASTTSLVTGLTAGSTTFTANYKSSVNTCDATFSNRSIAVIPLG